MGYPVGAKGVNAKATVYNLKDVKGFADTYWGVNAADTLFYGVGDLNVQNSKGVMLNIIGTSEVAAVDIAAGLSRMIIESVE